MQKIKQKTAEFRPNIYRSNTKNDYFANQSKIIINFDNLEFKVIFEMYFT